MALILGTKFGDHDCSFALVKDGEILRVYEEERFNRVKHGFTCNPISFSEILKDSNVTINDIDCFTNYLEPNRMPLWYENSIKFQGAEHATELRQHQDSIQKKLERYRRLMIAHGIPENKIVNVRHHMAHCAGVFYASPYEKAAILSVDGGGEADCAALAFGHGTELEIIKDVPNPHSLGNFYLTVTMWLGWGFGEEGKTMALASYGEPKFYSLMNDEFFQVGGDHFVTAKRPTGLSVPELEHILGPARQSGEPITQMHQDVAASAQALINDAMLLMAQHLKDETACTSLLITGGVGLNSVSNGVVSRSGIFDEVQAYPQANDTGTAIGGALFAEYHLFKGHRQRSKYMKHAYLGKELDIENLHAEAAKVNIEPRYSPNIEKEIAKELADGKIIGWLQGRAEIGPRALGNRSILGDPRASEMKNLINKQVKNRAIWRPFAPSVLEEDRHIFFSGHEEHPYMIIVDEVHDNMRETIPSVTHIDGSARVQTVNQELNPRYHRLLSEFKKLTNVGVLLNTSFNYRGEPVVQTVKQGLMDYIRSGIDILVVGDYIIDDKSMAPLVPDFCPFLENIAQLPKCDTYLIYEVGDVSNFRSQALNAIRNYSPNAKINYFYNDDISLCNLEVTNTFANSYPSTQQNLREIRKSYANYSVILLTSNSANQFCFDPHTLNNSLFDTLLEISDMDIENTYLFDKLGIVTKMQTVRVAFN